MSLAKRTAVLEQFRLSGRNGPRVLIISRVGMTGLNIPFANILVQLVRCSIVLSMVITSLTDIIT